MYSKFIQCRLITWGHTPQSCINRVNGLASKTKTLNIKVLNGAKQFLYFQVKLITSNVAWPVLYVFVIVKLV